eukprot:Selendium_serpulae@DN5500_c1_g1_i1.p1
MTAPQIQDGNLSADFLEILNTGRFSDVVVKLDNRQMHLHSLILMTRSRFFALMFSSQFEESIIGEDAKRTVELEDISYETATQFFNFLYTGVSSAASIDECLELLEVANRYQVGPLYNKMAAQIESQLSSGNCLDVLDLATKVRNDALRDAALKTATQTEVADLEAQPIFYQLNGDAMKLLTDAMKPQRDAAVERERIEREMANWCNSYTGDTPLCKAAEEGRLDVVTWL